MIPEKLIDNVLESMERSDFDSDLLQFKLNYPTLYAYLLNDQFELLTEDEFQLLLFNAMVIVRCFSETGISAQLQEEEIEACESENWRMLDAAAPAGFSEKLDVFFESSRQEDLLAFIEDSLVEDEDREIPISSVAREILFVSLKTIVDVFDQHGD